MSTSFPESFVHKQLVDMLKLRHMFREPYQIYCGPGMCLNYIQAHGAFSWPNEHFPSSQPISASILPLRVRGDAYVIFACISLWGRDWLDVSSNLAMRDDLSCLLTINLACISISLCSYFSLSQIVTNSCSRSFNLSGLLFAQLSWLACCCFPDACSNSKCTGRFKSQTRGQSWPVFQILCSSLRTLSIRSLIQLLQLSETVQFL